MRMFDWLFGWISENRQRREPSQDAGRKLSPAMPMAGAGAKLQARQPDSETEKAAKRAAENNDPQS